MLIVAAIIVDSLDSPTQVLCAQRNSPAELDGQWEFPGGKVEPGETPEGALHREIAEELGVTVDLGEIFATESGEDWPLPNGRPMRLWFAEISTGTPTPMGSHHQVTWEDATSIESLNWLIGDRPIVRQLLSVLQ